MRRTKIKKEDDEKVWCEERSALERQGLVLEEDGSVFRRMTPELLRTMNIPVRYRDLSRALPDSVNEMCRDYFRKWVTDIGFRKNAPLICGNRHLGMRVASGLMQAFRKRDVLSFQMSLLGFQDFLHDGLSGYYEHPINWMKSVQFLVLSDVDAAIYANSYGNADETLSSIIRQRMDENLSTCFVVRCGVKEFPDKVLPVVLDSATNDGILFDLSDVEYE